MQTLSCNLIGAGRLGTNIALALSSIKAVSILGIYNQSLESAEQAQRILQAGMPCLSISELPEADVIWICTNDDAIAKTAELLASHSPIKPGSFIIHSSGVLDANILKPLRDKGCFTASMHPLKAFKTGFIDSDAFNQVDCVVEGDMRVCCWLETVFKRLNARIFSISSDKKSLYHAAATIASNYLITLTSVSQKLFTKAGIPEDEALNRVLRLMQNNINNLSSTQSTADSLTGPLMRGDINTLKNHLQVIDNPLIETMYRTLGLLTLPLTQLEEEMKKDVVDLLEKNE